MSWLLSCFGKLGYDPTIQWHANLSTCSKTPIKKLLSLKNIWVYLGSLKASPLEIKKLEEPLKKFFKEDQGLIKEIFRYIYKAHDKNLGPKATLLYAKREFLEHYDDHQKAKEFWTLFEKAIKGPRITKSINAIRPYVSGASFTLALYSSIKSLQRLQDFAILKFGKPLLTLLTFGKVKA